MSVLCGQFDGQKIGLINMLLVCLNVVFAGLKRHIYTP
jgi:hypothetical protein